MEMCSVKPPKEVGYTAANRMWLCLSEVSSRLLGFGFAGTEQQTRYLPASLQLAAVAPPNKVSVLVFLCAHPLPHTKCVHGVGNAQHRPQQPGDPG